MYGLINRAIEELVTSLKGEAGWRSVCAHAALASDGFVAMQSYDDDITYRLVEAVSQRLGLPPEQVLEVFGEYWITYTAKEGYGSMLNAGGNSLREFLGNLNDMHGRVGTIFPQLRMPLFRVTPLSEDEYLLHYASTRAGLAPMVIGLVRGLAKRFDQQVTISLQHPRLHPLEEDIFIVREVSATF